MTRKQFWNLLNTGIPTYSELNDEFDEDPLTFKKTYGTESPREAYEQNLTRTLNERLTPYVHYPVTEDFSKKSGIKSWGQLKGKQVLPDFYDRDADTKELDDINDFVNDTETVEYWAPAFEKFGNVDAIYTAVSNYDDTSNTYDPDRHGGPVAIFATDDPDWEKNLMKTAKKWQIDDAIRKAMKRQKIIADAVKDWK